MVLALLGCSLRREGAPPCKTRGGHGLRSWSSADHWRPIHPSPPLPQLEASQLPQIQPEAKPGRPEPICPWRRKCPRSDCVAARLDLLLACLLDSECEPCLPKLSQRELAWKTNESFLTCASKTLVLTISKDSNEQQRPQSANSSASSQLGCLGRRGSCGATDAQTRDVSERWVQTTAEFLHLRLPHLAGQRTETENSQTSPSLRINRIPARGGSWDGSVAASQRRSQTALQGLGSGKRWEASRSGLARLRPMPQEGQPACGVAAGEMERWRGAVLVGVALSSRGSVIRGQQLGIS
ncbi:hypothetical protein B0J18DRAFT_224146 [Chaetomium sp. MPI-SDFR-AT-0129]|nr:hypothetical protein B0J18DRAFT_224146 [Chaetomium sp. MPI-SDFR-AT-0129]